MNADPKTLEDVVSDMEESTFASRHIGPRDEEINEMLAFLNVESLDALSEKTVPASILRKVGLSLPAAATEAEALAEIREIARQNRLFRSYIGLGYYNSITPPVILRNIMENPGWYTQYTPYQAEIAQGRLEALLNFQTMVADLCGMDLANASLLDEGTAAAEAMTMCARLQPERTVFYVSADVHPPTIDVVQTRAEPLGIDVRIGDVEQQSFDGTCLGVLVQYPDTNGEIRDFRALATKVQAAGGMVIAATDLLSLAVLTAPGEWGADVAIGNSQRFGVPLGFGGPHAGFLATKDAFKRELPGRLVGVSKDSAGKPAFRLALQTREQHIRREKATSNICTAQVLLAIMASMYAVYHGPKGIRRIAENVQRKTTALKQRLTQLGVTIENTHHFDTIKIAPLGGAKNAVLERARAHEVNLRLYESGAVGISIDETTTVADLVDLVAIVTGKDTDIESLKALADCSIASMFKRTSEYLTHPVFSSYHSETELLRYITRLQSRDVSLAHSMIPLGSCTMKLNATAEMIPVTWSEFGGIHPFVPIEQAQGYMELITQLETWLGEITGLPGVSLQPNAGSQGEYAGLLVIRRYLQEQGQAARTICLIPTSAHGTNPASAVLAGMKVVPVRCDEMGNIDLDDLRVKAEEHRDKLACVMITYPSTHGVFESPIREICQIIKDAGGLVYMDGANLNAQVGLCRPGDFGVDVCHLNLHKTFCIPHGGGGPGVGPIAVQKFLAPYLPKHRYANCGGEDGCGSVCSAPWGSASILPISWTYIRMMGGEGLVRATQVAILNANYVAERLQPHFPVLYRGENGMVAHECILDLRRYKRTIGVDVTDVAKRLMDYGFHAPTVSWPVVETLMVEPTESESKQELDRFCDAMIGIRQELQEVESGAADKTNNVLKNAPHTLDALLSDEWNAPYSREKAAYPLAWLRGRKVFPSVGRIDSAYGDRNLFCSCIPVLDAE